MKVRDIMTGPAITVAADETVEVAAEAFEVIRERHHQ